MRRKKMHSSQLSAFLLVAVLGALACCLTGCHTAVCHYDSGGTISDGSQCGNRPRLQRRSRRHLPRRLGHRPNPSRLGDRGPRENGWVCMLERGWIAMFAPAHDRRLYTCTRGSNHHGLFARRQKGSGYRCRSV